MIFPPAGSGACWYWAEKAMVPMLFFQARAQESLVTHKSLAPDLALELAQAALAECRQQGYQVAIAVVDRFGIIQVILRDRYAGPHTTHTASGKAWTAATFRTSTSNLLAI